MADYFVNKVNSSFKSCKKPEKALIVGLTCIDIVNECKEFPIEDQDSRVLSQTWAVGGNAANTSRVLAQHENVDVHLFSGLSNKNENSFVINDLKSYGVNLEHCSVYENKMFPTSCCILNSQNGSRTILACNHDFPKLDHEKFKTMDILSYNIIHFEGRDIPQISQMIDHVITARGDNELPLISGEMEKPRRLTEMENLLQNKCDILIISKDIAEAKGFQTASKTLEYYSKLESIKAKYIVCTWGEKGASFAEKANDERWKIEDMPSFKIDQPVDTLGAGDVFNAGLLYGILGQNTLKDSTKYACFLAKEKCLQLGFKNLSYT